MTLNQGTLPEIGVQTLPRLHHGVPIGTPGERPRAPSVATGQDQAATRLHRSNCVLFHGNRHVLCAATVRGTL